MTHNDSGRWVFSTGHRVRSIVVCAAGALLVANVLTPTAGSAAPAAPAYVSSGPITLTSGQTVTGLHVTNPNGPCITGRGVTNVRITNNRIGPCGPGYPGVGVQLENASHSRIDHNTFHDVSSAFYAIGGSGGGLWFDHNHATKIRGPFPRGQLVQFNNVSGPNHEICCNVSDQPIGGWGAGPEDHINMYQSNGTPDSPIRIRANKLRGGGTKNGSGIMLGDGSRGTHQVARRNILVDPGQVGIGIAGGHYNKVTGNKVYGARHPWSNVGMYVWNGANAPCSNHTVKDNRVNYTNRNGQQNAFWDGRNCGPITGLSQNSFGDTTIGPAIWNEKFPECDGW